VTHRIQNFDELNTNPLRGSALTIAEAAYTAIDTNAAIRSKISFEGTTLVVDGRSYDLSWFRRIRVIGFGKVSCAAAQTIESLLRGHIESGVVIDVRPGVCDVIEVAQGSHPKPSEANVAVSKRVVDMAQDSDERDLVIVIVSGGGSSLLCWPLEECTLSGRLYDDLIKTGATIEEMNTVRKHISDVKGGGLAKMLHPATVVGLVFCDVPGDHFEEVASGPTYLDKTTADDARAVLKRYHLSGYEVHETPKDPALFERVHNVPIVSNSTALDAMENSAKSLGFSVVRVGSDLFDTAPELVERLFAPLKEKTAVIGAGEPSLTITHKGGKGGRCQYIALQALERVRDNEILLAFASDGIDNTEAAGAIADTSVRAQAKKKNLSIPDRLADYDTYVFIVTRRKVGKRG
jgi:glycerate-2-kinase